ncbi:MAG: acyl-CoA dehydrogenase [Desulfosarcina sp.]|jgi:alkylation response protein AidB-like acyl-CoA dehydrogenase
MKQSIADRNDIDFVLYEQIAVEALLSKSKFKNINRKTIDLIVKEARNLAIKEILPTLAEGDRTGVKFENGLVQVPECYHRPYRLMQEGEWIAMTADAALGGQGLPHCVALAASEYFIGANSAFALYVYVCHAAGELIELFGTEKQKDLYLKNMYTGKWCGTMLLTEPQAGSDVGALSTTAIKNADGTYSLTGNKIFITAGDHDLTENIIHPVLARIEGAPSGTKGISLFLVPKILVNEDGSLGDPNDIVCTGVIEKMGIHGSATCSMALGSKGNCRGYLLGEEESGMQIMFRMMNTSRLAIGIVGFACASHAFLVALNYAKERLQGKDIGSHRDPEAPQVPIIHHPDVRRMLLWMKSHVEGMRSLAYYTCLAVDLAMLTKDKEKQVYYQDLVDLLTPVVKSYFTDRGFDICVEAMQVMGGYGYTKDYPLEQLLRDCKVTSIYEGTNGIQAMDLLGRKLGMKKGMVFMSLLNEIHNTVEKARSIPELNDLADKLSTAADLLGKTALHLGTAAMSPKLKEAFAYAKPFLDVVGDVSLAWMHVWRATIAATQMKKIVGSLDPAERIQQAAINKKAVFYEGVLQTATFFINVVVPITIGKMNGINSGDTAVIDIPDASMGVR